MTTPLAQLFEKTRSENRAALIGYLPAGFPSEQECIDAISAMVEGGVDAIEIGFPYSDPVMDGPIIQAAADLSLRNGTGAKEVFSTLAAVTGMGTPAVVMTYWNPIERYGVENFAHSIAAAGGSGVITPDLTIEEAGDWRKAVIAANINSIFVVAPSTKDERLAAVTQECSGFIYAASLMGVTGTRTAVSSSAKDLVERVRKVSDTPVAVGLGVSTQAQARRLLNMPTGSLSAQPLLSYFTKADRWAKD